MRRYKKVVQICVDSSCHLKGSAQIVEISQKAVTKSIVKQKFSDEGMKALNNSLEVLKDIIKSAGI